MLKHFPTTDYCKRIYRQRKNNFTRERNEGSADSGNKVTFKGELFETEDPRKHKTQNSIERGLKQIFILDNVIDQSDTNQTMEDD